MLRQFILDASDAGGLVNESYALSMAATLGQKGGAGDYYTCSSPYTGGEHVLSVVYVPTESRMLVAWEDGTGAAWTPASCTMYVPIDLAAWWN